VSGFMNRPKILRGAFVEYGLTVPPLAVLFQFNPVQLQRSRSMSFRTRNEDYWCRGPGEAGEEGAAQRFERPAGLRKLHEELDDLGKVRENQIVSVEEETLNFELRLDATDALDSGNLIASTCGVSPALSTLELMTHPKGESVLTQALSGLLGPKVDLRFTKPENPPLVLFIWGVQRVLPVNINNLSITETEFDTLLNPVRATVSVSLTVIEGKNSFFRFTKTAKEAMSVLNVANVVTDIVIPG
jgi:hypothetical protein